MLVITRRVGEVIFINDDIKLVVLGVKRDQMRIGITAPQNVPVHRMEVYEKIVAEKAALSTKKAIRAKELEL